MPTTFATINLGITPDRRRQQRLLRSAVHKRDTIKLQNLINQGINVNTVISDVFQDTPLTYSVKCGFLELVELLAECPGCDLDQRDRGKHSPLDEAIRAWFRNAGATAQVKSDTGKRYRIIRCLLASGAKDITISLLDTLIFSVLNTKEGHVLVGKLVKVFCNKGCVFVKSTLLSVLMPHRNVCRQLETLLRAAAVPEIHLVRSPVQPFMPLDNAVVLLKATNKPEILHRIMCDTSFNIKTVEDDWFRYRNLLRLLIMCGYKIQLHLLNYLYRHHADTYKWYVTYSTDPRPLCHLSRIAVRKQLRPNVIVGSQKLKSLPKLLRKYLLFDEDL